MRFTKALERDGVISAAQYKKLREKIGSREEFATRVGVHPQTIRKRETEVHGYPITREATIAILTLSGVWK